ncbi:peptidoglycan-binding domain-containing protein [Kitasatospora sp. NPDC048722]|uniref:peptidoglycan-binding domain-containing protein n=1 Tax=Kitasatospora sp. NPDC048722 TaxID=3155639 RepID=UPI0033EF6212
MSKHTWTRRAATLAVGAAAVVGLTAGVANAAGNLALNSYGPAVACLQRALDDVNGAGLDVDQHFGPLTDQAVRNWQGSHGLQPDGVVGPLTGGSLKTAMSQAAYAANHAHDPSAAEFNNWEANCSGQLPG